jgi:hypothetical protein
MSVRFRVLTARYTRGQYRVGVILEETSSWGHEDTVCLEDRPHEQIKIHGHSFGKINIDTGRISYFLFLEKPSFPIEELVGKVLLGIPKTPDG